MVLSRKYVHKCAFMGRTNRDGKQIPSNEENLMNRDSVLSVCFIFII